MRTVELVLKPEDAFDEEQFMAALYRKMGFPPDGGVRIHPIKRSIDARARDVVVRVQCEILSPSEARPESTLSELRDVSGKEHVIIVGSGPAGLFAALRLIELGLKPIVVERGKDVQTRRRDLAAINKDHIVNPESNYCFGEGGAGTYSDGKLYTRSKKRGHIRRILERLVAHGAKEEILFDAHPHIGTNKLPLLVAGLRKTILAAGGEVHFDTKVTDLIVEAGRVRGVVTAQRARLLADVVILATGHSARDVFQLLYRRNILIEAKAFALGVRIEHEQVLIDQVQYHCAHDRGPYLPPSSYTLVHQSRINGSERGVFSFCMCPGGFVVPAATSPGEVVVNGMSPSRRDSRFANSGIVVAVNENDFGEFREHGPLAGMYFQASIEKLACDTAGGTQRAPAQRMVDFVEGKVSSTLPETSYMPGLASTDMGQILPHEIMASLREGFVHFGKKMKGYLTNDSQVIGVESRTSSPVKIPRDKETLEHPQVSGLFPCGEGAGYAGGIVSAAMDGERCAEAAAMKLLSMKIEPQ